MSSELFVNKITGTSGTSGGAPITLSGDTATLGTGTTIGASATITDGANPHGWEHIKTISYSADTATPQKMSNVVSSTYSAYKIFAQWSPSSDNVDLWFRFLDSSDTEIADTRYSYGYQLTSETGAEGATFQSTGVSAAQVANDILRGSRGFNAEITLYNCYASSSSYPQIDGYQLDNTKPRPAAPHAFYLQTGHDSGNYDQGGNGFFWYDNDEKYVTGFQLHFQGNANLAKGSFWSVFGLKLPTAD